MILKLYHSKSLPICKEHIENEFSISGGASAKVILATTAIDSSVNYPVINIVHFLSPSRTFEMHIQQQAYDITIYANKNFQEHELDTRDNLNIVVQYVLLNVTAVLIVLMLLQCL